MKKVFTSFGLLLAVLAGGLVLWHTQHGNNIQDFSKNLEKQNTSSSTVVMDNWKKYTFDNEAFSFFYPAAWMFSKVGATDPVPTVSSPEKYIEGTNLSNAEFRVIVLRGDEVVAKCTAVPENVAASSTTTMETINGQNFKKIMTKEAATGTRYETARYRAVHNGACYSVETALVYSSLELYGDDTEITAFKRQNLEKTLDRMVRTFQF